MDIIFDHVSKVFGEKQVFRDFCCQFAEGKTSCILGPSGCGKTTLLRLIAGLEKPDSGKVTGADQKNSAVFQENRLFENLTVEKNLMLTARKDFTRADAQTLLRDLGLEAEERKPLSTLSGGMQRRVAVARALAADYDLLLLDEPLTGLDGETRRKVLSVIQKMTAGKTIIWVTHQAEDALYLSAEIFDFSRISG